MSNNPSSKITPGNGRRNRLLTTLAIVVVVAALGYGIYHFWHGRWFERTEDAYANGDIIEVTSLVPGTIVEISADDNMRVTAGQVLLRLDPSDARVALEQAEAALARAVRQVRGLYANVEGQNADLAAKQVMLDRARADVERRRGLENSGAIAKEEMAHAQAIFESAQRALAISREQLAATHALTDDTSVGTHPEVKAAAAAVRRAYLDFARSTLRAAVTGYVTQRSAQLGQHVNPGAPLMSLVPLDRLWVDANFKETQLEHIRIGQPVELKSDVYGGSVVYHGRIASLGVGTGSAMSLLPAQNATGNWIKIVQRVPVRIALDPKELAARPLRLGMSMHVEVDMHDRSGAVLAPAPADKPVYTSDSYREQLLDADARVKEIVRANFGATK